MSASGIFLVGQTLDISTYYEIAIWTNDNVTLPLPKILVSNDNVVWCEYGLLKSNYQYLATLMGNYIKVENPSQPDMVIHYNANLKK